MSKEEIIQELEDAIEAIIDDVVESDGWYMTGAGTAAEKNNRIHNEQIHPYQNKNQ